MKIFLIVSAITLIATASHAQQVMDGSGNSLGPNFARNIAARLVGKTSDPYSAQIIQLHFSTDGPYTDSICGLVNLKNQYGAYTGFQPFLAEGENIFLQASAKCQ